MTGYLSMAIYQLVDIDVLRRIRVPIDQSDQLTNGAQYCLRLWLQGNPRPSCTGCRQQVFIEPDQGYQGSVSV
jgi:hypothetical protein